MLAACTFTGPEPMRQSAPAGAPGCRALAGPGAAERGGDMTRRWVFLADPGDYGWAELVRDGRAVWDGVRNPTALKHLRSVDRGEPVLIYHTSPERSLVGTAQVSSAPRDEGTGAVVEVEPVQALRRRVSLAELREDPLLASLGFVRMPRVAVQPISEREWDRVMELSGTDPGTAENEDPALAGGP
jgi:predicted RNA-binding protein with PUA-like domain